MRELLDEWSAAENLRNRFKVIYCVGSRWANVHMGAKSREYIPPPPPEGFDDLANAELVVLI